MTDTTKILPKIILYKANFRTKFHLNTEICKEVRIIENILWQILFKNPNTLLTYTPQF